MTKKRYRKIPEVDPVKDANRKLKGQIEQLKKENKILKSQVKTLDKAFGKSQEVIEHKVRNKSLEETMDFLSAQPKYICPKCRSDKVKIIGGDRVQIIRCKECNGMKVINVCKQ